MKKSIFLLFLLISSSAVFSQTKKSIVATYEGFDGTVYSFVDAEEEYHMFDLLDAAVKKQYNLETEEYNYELFKVTYTETTNEEGDVYLKIVGLEIQASDEEDEDGEY